MDPTWGWHRQYYFATIINVAKLKTYAVCHKKEKRVGFMTLSGLRSGYVSESTLQRLLAQSVFRVCLRGASETLRISQWKKGDKKLL